MVVGELIAQLDGLGSVDNDFPLRIGVGVGEGNPHAPVIGQNGAVNAVFERHCSSCHRRKDVSSRHWFVLFRNQCLTLGRHWKYTGFQSVFLWFCRNGFPHFRRFSASASQPRADGGGEGIGGVHGGDDVLLRALAGRFGGPPLDPTRIRGFQGGGAGGGFARVFWQERQDDDGADRGPASRSRCASREETTPRLLRRRRRSGWKRGDGLAAGGIGGARRRCGRPR